MLFRIGFHKRPAELAAKYLSHVLRGFGSGIAAVHFSSPIHYIVLYSQVICLNFIMLSLKPECMIDSVWLSSTWIVNCLSLACASFHTFAYDVDKRKHSAGSDFTSALSQMLGAAEENRKRQQNHLNRVLSQLDRALELQEAARVGRVRSSTGSRVSARRNCRLQRWLMCCPSWFRCEAQSI